MAASPVREGLGVDRVPLWLDTGIVPRYYPSRSLQAPACPEQLQEVVRQADQQPLCLDLVEAAEREAPEAAGVLICPNTGSTIAFRRA